MMDGDSGGEERNLVEGETWRLPSYKNKRSTTMGSAVTNE